jgi:hypothetical protein
VFSTILFISPKKTWWVLAISGFLGIFVFAQSDDHL